MDRLRVAFYVFDNFGVLRHMARFVRSETGIKEVDFYDRISRDALAQPQQWPIIASVVRMMNDNLAPPSSWGLFVDEVGRYVATVLGVEAGSALDTALAGAAGAPAGCRSGDAAEAAAAARLRGLVRHGARAPRRARITTTGRPSLLGCVTSHPESMVVSDPNDVCGTMVGKPIMRDGMEHPRLGHGFTGGPRSARRGERIVSSAP